MLRPRACSTVVFLLLALIAPAAAQAAPKRVVSIEWDNTENLLALGVKPVGIADADLMRTWTPINPPDVPDVGSRVQPDIEKIASLDPDLIVITIRPGSEKLVAQLRRVAKVLVLDPYTGKGGRGALHRRMIEGLRRTAAAVGQRARGDAVIRALERDYATLRRRIKRAGHAGDTVAFGTPAGTTDRPRIAFGTDYGVTATVLNRLGLRNAWHGKSDAYGWTIAAPEALVKVQNADWMLFAIPSQYRPQLNALRSQQFFRELSFVKRNRFRTLPGNTWVMGGPLSARVLARRVAATVTG